MNHIDGFTQAKQTNIKVCDGCHKRCKFDATEINGRYYPTFVTAIPTIITQYIDQNGAVRHISSHNLPGLGTKLQAIVQSRQIAQLCDFYQKTK